MKRLIRTGRWRSERPPTVFDWLMRHWLSRGAAFTRPNFGTAISMSNTLAVETYSGGSPRICSMETVPSFRSFFNCARFTRMSFARLRASILWSNERTGACTCVWGGTMRAALYQPHSRGQAGRFCLVCQAGNVGRRHAERIGRTSEAGACRFGVELFAHTPRRTRVCEQHRADCNV